MIRIRLTFKSSLAQIMVFFLCFMVARPVLAQQSTPVFGVKIKSDEGAGATTPVKSPSTEPPVVVVTDANDRPIQGAIVVFSTPDSGSSGVFEDGTRSMTVATDRDGRAAAVGYRANGIAGTYPIQIHAAFLDETADATVTHTNVAASKSSKKLITILAIAGGGAAVGLLAAGHGGGGSGSTTTTTPALPTITFGGSSVGAPGQ
jgi:hypothetical protein